MQIITELRVSVQAGETRPERSISRHYISELTVMNGGRWGSWGHREMCPTGTYAAGFSLKVDRTYAFLGDSTALNGIRLHCVNTNASGFPHSYDNYASIHSDVGSWGRWTDIKWCPSGFLTAFQLRVEGSQGAGDDTAANNIRFKCSGRSFLLGDGTHWGDWGDWSNMCEGKGICGIKTRVEEPHGTWGDDTALNDMRMFCCS
ncbi:vitelline membrane outer layer protein 1-like isoform X2 [Puntigrus tetrazona]|uniref:vitelline membrane outer layer protein 1-like isoform X2 n=1 Tax=Puntigrus tetrazona TaxID=1606681 RepID=UPI001C8A8F5F|nr:vitelline membrane outer layer protein 1-like isoform X2 [Puntigrus tetrazona]